MIIFTCWRWRREFPPLSTDSEIEQESVMEIDISTAGASYTTHNPPHTDWDKTVAWWWVILILISLNEYSSISTSVTSSSSWRLLRGEEREGLLFSSSLPYDQFSNGNATPWEERSPANYLLLIERQIKNFQLPTVPSLVQYERVKEKYSVPVICSSLSRLP